MFARWISLGTVPPHELYAVCQGVAEVQRGDAPPVVLWARPDRPHVSIGASQRPAAELDREACRRLGVKVCRRPLGGGTVLVDSSQWCFFFILPRTRAGCSRDAFFGACLEPVMAVFRDFGLAAERVGRGDLWVGGRKILGSGAATIGTADVLGASFLLRFDEGLFAQLVHCPSPAFRTWLEEELRSGMTDWARSGILPGGSKLQDRFMSRVTAAFGWELCEDSLTDAERRATADALHEVRTEWDEPGRRLIPHGIKINDKTYLVEYRDEKGWVRLVVRDHVISRIEGSDEAAGTALAACLGMPPAAERLVLLLERYLDAHAAARWAARIGQAVHGIGSGGDD